MQRGKYLVDGLLTTLPVIVKQWRFFFLTFNYFHGQNWYLTDQWPSLGEGSFQIDRKHQTQFFQFARFFDFVNNLQFRKK